MKIYHFRSKRKHPDKNVNGNITCPVQPLSRLVLPRNYLDERISESRKFSPLRSTRFIRWMHFTVTDNSRTEEESRLITLRHPRISRASTLIRLTSRRSIRACSLRRGGWRAGRRDGWRRRRRRQRPALRCRARGPVVVPQQAVDGEWIQPLSLLSALHWEINAAALDLLLAGGLPDQIIPDAGADRLLTARSDDSHQLASSLQQTQAPMANTSLVVQMLHRWRILRILPRLAGLVSTTVERRITLAVHGTVGRRVHPLASALAAGI